MLTDRRSEFCGNPEHQQYELYPAVENIDRRPFARLRAISAEGMHETEQSE
jgi:hypothetical protein